MRRGLNALDSKHPEICRYCGAHVHFLVMDEDVVTSGKPKWEVVNPDLTLHRCGQARTSVKVFTAEERREFQRRREAGEV